jgi:hypothetical protein
MKREKNAPGAWQGTEGHNKWTNSDSDASTLNSTTRLATGSGDDEIADSVSRLFKPQLPNTLSVF